MPKSNRFFFLLFLLTVPFCVTAAPFFYNSVSYNALYKTEINKETGTPEFCTVYFKPGKSIYMRIFPYEDRVKADVVVYGQRIYNRTVIPISWEKILEKNFEDIIDASRAVIDWDLLLAAQNKAHTRNIQTITERIDAALPEINLADSKAMSEKGKWVDIPDGSEYSRALVNSFGFVKWIGDGFYKPATGYLMNLNDLVLRHFEEAPNNNWLIKETFKRNPYFGMDWIKNIGLKLNRLSVPDVSIDEIEVRSLPFYGFTETAGFDTPALRFVMYYLAAKEPSRFYFISYSRPSRWDGDRTLLEHSRTAVAFPSIDYRGLLNIAYYENGKKFSAEEIENRIGDADIYLIGVELSTLFHLPPVKNLSILYR